MKFSKAFTLIELIFVIVILGVLAAVALPRFAEIRVQADTANGIADIATIQAALVNERQRGLILGNPDFIDVGNGTDELDEGQLVDGGIFGGILVQSISDDGAIDGGWHFIDRPDVNTTRYDYQVNGITARFSYAKANGTFTCDEAAGTPAQQALCTSLID